MMYKQFIVLLLTSALLLSGCAHMPASSRQTGPIDSTLYVKKVENMPEDFILGMDASSVLAEEASGVVYYGFDGKEQDVFQTLRDAGITHIRVRVWNDPYDEDGNGYGGGNNDLDKAVQIGKRATKFGLKLIVDFHYSDFWADPGKQMVPKAWAGLPVSEKAEALYEFTRDSLQRLRDEKIAIGMVQLGNETNGKLCGETAWPNITALMQAGSKAVREICPDALIAVHFANPENAGSFSDYAWRLATGDVDYDVFASSYYPFWHGTLDNLSTVLSGIAETYGKKVMVMETSYAYTPEDTDFSGNTISEGSLVTKDYPYTVQGQANSLRNIIDTIVNQTKNGIGVVYWEGTWITVGQNSWEENHQLWEKYGSGWASSYAAAYDPDDAGKYYGGSAVDNQALFDPEGKPLESLKVFNLVRYGNDAEIKADAIADTELRFDLAEPVVLPDTVNAVMTDGSKQAVPVDWEVSEAQLSAMNSGIPAEYELHGTAEGLPAYCHIAMIAFNYLENGDFESGEASPWVAADLAGAEQLYVEKKQTDSLSGEWHYHFWSPAANSVEFTLEQTLTELPEGSYEFSISIMGGDSGAAEIYAYAKINGETVGTCPMKITSYGEWDKGVVSNLSYQEGQTLTVGIYVKCAGDGNGAWGKIDDARLNSIMN